MIQTQFFLSPRFPFNHHYTHFQRKEWLLGGVRVKAVFTGRQQWAFSETINEGKACERRAGKKRWVRLRTHRGADLEQNISFGASDRHWQLDVTIVNYVLAMMVSVETVCQSWAQPKAPSTKSMYTLLPLPPVGQRQERKGAGTSGPRVLGRQAWALKDHAEGCALTKAIHVGCSEQ